MTISGSGDATDDKIINSWVLVPDSSVECSTTGVLGLGGLGSPPHETHSNRWIQENLVKTFSIQRLKNALDLQELTLEM